LVLFYILFTVSFLVLQMGLECLARSCLHGCRGEKNITLVCAMITNLWVSSLPALTWTVMLRDGGERASSC